jgi:hypothetical protein
VLAKEFGQEKLEIKRALITADRAIRRKSRTTARRRHLIKSAILALMPNTGLSYQPSLLAKADITLRPFLALGAFAGLRTAIATHGLEGN